MKIMSFAGIVSFIVTLPATAQSPSYAKDIRPLLAKYCLECHNAKAQKGTLDLESHKAILAGSDTGAVVIAGKPDESKLVLLTEHKQKPIMPPAKAKLQPTKAEVQVLRAWVAAGAKDDAVVVKVELPEIKAKKGGLGPVTALTLNGHLLIARRNMLTLVYPDSAVEKHHDYGRNVSAMNAMFIASSKSGESTLYVWFWGATKITGLPLGRHSDTILDIALTKKTEKLRPTIASASYDSQIRLYTISDDLPFKTTVLKEHSDAVYGLAFSPDGKMLASVSADRAMKVFDVETGKLLYTLGEATDWLYTVAWSPDGKRLVSAGVDKSIRVYEPTPMGAKLLKSVFAHEGPVQKVLFSNDSKTLYSVGQDRVIKAWDVEKMVERKVYDQQPETVMCMALREDAGQIIIGRYDGIVQLIDIKTGKVVREFGEVKKPAAKPLDERSFNSPLPWYSGGEGLGVRGMNLQKSQGFAWDSVPPTPPLSPRSTRGRGGQTPCSRPTLRNRCAHPGA